ncbi:MAG: BREX system P-loop protein BrxC, partial [Candidatus Marinimicrobia bacterium]|nr:BREX system P-loop protein BrxC [Candidatus Neomarinimicrobiota bacterium]
MKNYELFSNDPRSFTIPNDGVTTIGAPRSEQEWDVVRYELRSFVCEGEYQKGLERILSTFLSNLDQPKQPAAWVSGFYGSGKSHLVRVLEYIWRDMEFSDGAKARSLVNLPTEIKDLLIELSTAGKRQGGLWSAAGTCTSSDFSDTYLMEAFRLA